VEKGRFEDSGRGATALIKGNAKSTKHSSFWQQSRELIVCYPGRVALGSLLDFSEAAGYYGLFAFLALFILPAVAVAPSLVPWFYLIGNLGALVGGIAFIAPLALTIVANAAGKLAALALLAAFWLIGVIAMIPWCFRGVEGRGMPLEAMMDFSGTGGGSA
jgi:hypothetical protein